MSLDYPTTETFTFGGITTEAELLRASRVRSAIMARNQARAAASDDVQLSDATSDSAQNDDTTSVGMESDQSAQSETPMTETAANALSPTQIMSLLLNSHPVTALDWIIIILIVVSFALLAQAIARFISPKNSGARYVGGGPICELCGGAF